jgi:quercetin dioxygenase-like cupin family protein
MGNAPLPLGGPETSPLPPIRRIVTGHNDQGQAIVAIDDNLKAPILPHGNGVQTIWSNDTFPADLSEAGDRAYVPVPIVNNGSIFRIVDVAPNTSGHMHRTTSIDYAILLNGTLVMRLDDGSKTTLRPGDSVVQQGTNHQWENPTGEWARLLAVLLPAHEPLINGKKLTDESGAIGDKH